MATAAAMQRQTMHHVLSQLGRCTHPPTLQPRRGSRHASTSDEDEGRCSSAGEASPPASEAHPSHPRTLARAVSMPSTAAKHRGPAWLHGNALGSKAMHAVLQQAVVAHSVPPISRPTTSQPMIPVSWLGDGVRLRPTPRCDLERMALCVTPLLWGSTPPERLTLADVLHVFEQPSLHGLPVPTHHGGRGRSTAYYLPSLSAMRLFVAATSKDESGPRWRLPNGDVVRVAAEAFEAEAPFAREPVDERVLAVLNGRGVDPETPLSHLHPQSWYVYRKQGCCWWHFDVFYYLFVVGCCLLKGTTTLLSTLNNQQQQQQPNTGWQWRGTRCTASPMPPWLPVSWPCTRCNLNGRAPTTSCCH